MKINAIELKFERSDIDETYTARTEFFDYTVCMIINGNWSAEIAMGESRIPVKEVGFPRKLQTFATPQEAFNLCQKDFEAKIGRSLKIPQ